MSADNLSELEREFELEMDLETGGTSAWELEAAFESMLDDDDDLDDEYEFESDGDGDFSDYAERFYELSLRSFESESELDYELSRLFEQMEQEFFLGGLARKIGRGVSRGARNLVRQGRRLARQGVRAAARGFPAIQAVKALTGLQSGGLKGLLGSVAKLAMGPAGKTLLASAVPGGAAALPILKALGFEASEDAYAEREAWNRFVDLSRESFEYLAENIDETTDDPMRAAELSMEAFEAGLSRVMGQPARVRPRGNSAARREIVVRPGDRIVIVSRGN